MSLPPDPAADQSPPLSLLDPDGLVAPSLRETLVRLQLPRALPSRAALGLPVGLHCFAQLLPAGDAYMLLLGPQLLNASEEDIAEGPWHYTRLGDFARVYRTWLAWTWRPGESLLIERRWNPVDGVGQAVHGLTSEQYQEARAGFARLDIYVQQRGRPPGPTRYATPAALKVAVDDAIREVWARCKPRLPRQQEVAATVFPCDWGHEKASAELLRRHMRDVLGLRWKPYIRAFPFDH
jgi:hypothetical protein